MLSLSRLKIIPIIAAIAFHASADITANVERHGRRVQIDGFLLEWNKKNANRWDDSLWTWDAVITPDGVAGYFASRSAAACSSWAFTIGIVGVDKTLEIKIPEQVQNDFFAFDKGSFESAGVYTAEWLVPWSLLKGSAAKNNNTVNKDNPAVNKYMLTLNAASGCGDTLQTLRLSVNPEKTSSGLSLYYIMFCIFIAALVTAPITVLIIKLIWRRLPRKR